MIKLLGRMSVWVWWLVSMVGLCSSVDWLGLVVDFIGWVCSGDWLCLVWCRGTGFLWFGCIILVCGLVVWFS